MAKSNGILLARIDERVKTIFNEIGELKEDIEKASRKQDDANKRHYSCQTEILPKMMMEIRLLKQRPLGITAWFFDITKKLLLK